MTLIIYKGHKEGGMAIKEQDLDKSLQLKGRRQVISCSAKMQKKDNWEYIGMYSF